MKSSKPNLLYTFNIVTGLASILSAFYLLFSNSTNAIIALSAFCLFLLVSLLTLIYGIKEFIKKENQYDHIKVSSFTSFETFDQTHYAFETYRVIQSKRLILTRVTQRFKWTGSKMPLLSSNLQTITKIKEEGKDDYDSAELKLQAPLLYNQTTTIHFKAEMDDFDNISQPHLDYKVDKPINIIHYRVILRHKDSSFKTPATLKRMPINSKGPSTYEEFGSIPFDAVSKSYNYDLINPEVGYYYRIEWIK